MYLGLAVAPATWYNKSRNRDVPDVRASLKVGLQMEQVKVSIS